VKPGRENPEFVRPEQKRSVRWPDIAGCLPQLLLRSAVPVPPRLLRVSEDVDALVTLLDLVRTGAARTRPQLSELSGLGRTVITPRLATLIDSGLLTEGVLAPSSGGRPARELRFSADAGLLLTADLGASSIAAATTTLDGRLIASHEQPFDIAAGPEAVLGALEDLFDDLLTRLGEPTPPLWAIGIGLPGPVEYATGRPVAPPIMPGWDAYPVRSRLSVRYDVPVWVDNEVNLMTLGELRAGAATGVQEVVVVKAGTGIGAGLVSHGRLHRGAQGVAGDIGHIPVPESADVQCHCGKVGCLEVVAGGAALGQSAMHGALTGRSPALARRLESATTLGFADLAWAARQGDDYALEVVDTAGRTIGRALAIVVNIYNPELVVISGPIAQLGQHVLTPIHDAIRHGGQPLATRDLRVEISALGRAAGLRGAAHAVLDELFSPRLLARWIARGTPCGSPELSDVA
jgi:glucokinase-like ROK family protein